MKNYYLIYFIFLSFSYSMEDHSFLSFGHMINIKKKSDFYKPCRLEIFIPRNYQEDLFTLASLKQNITIKIPNDEKHFLIS
jgi:hypothetical protein